MKKTNLFFGVLIIGLFVSLSACQDKAKQEQAAREKATADSLNQVRIADSLKALDNQAQNATPTAALSSLLSGTFLSLAQETKLFEKLKEGEKYTVFAPTDEVLGAAKIDKAQQADVVQYHVVKGEFSIPMLENGQELETLQGGKLKVEIKEGILTVGGAEVTEQDLKATNGVVHKINKVLLPKK